MVAIYGEDRTDGLLEIVKNRANGNQPRPGDGNSKGPCIPYGFWGRFMEEDMQIVPSDRKQTQLRRCLTYYVLSRNAGARTTSAMRGMHDRGSCRGHGAALNARKAPGLDLALLQWFVDCVQRLSCRADSCMLMKKPWSCAIT